VKLKAKKKMVMNSYNQDMNKMISKYNKQVINIHHAIPLADSTNLLDEE